MITNSTQIWTIGQQVKVGFMSLVVRAAVATPGDYAPDAYVLSNAKGTNFYKFVPHKGVSKLDADEAQELINQAEMQAA